MADPETVKLRYASNKNITFHGEIDTQISREDWDDYSEDTQRDVIQEFLNELVEISVVDE